MSVFVWKTKEVAAEHCAHPENVRRVLILYTGGTIGMKWSKETGYHPASDYLESKIRTYPMLHDPSYVIPEDERKAMEPFVPLALPLTFHRYRVLYCIHEYNPLLDSSNMSMDDWARISEDITTYYQKFNAFIILHGTDTMCYTASALSFMLDNLGKSVILTGSQVPLSELRSDGRDNLLGALVLAGQYVIPEVAIYFHNKLFRGNRSTKTNSASFEAFQSPNLPPLASVGIDISVDWDAVHRPVRTEKLDVHTEMNQNVGILRIFPGMTAATVRSFLQPPMQGVVLQTFGAGNIPDIRSSLLEELQAACKRGIVIVNCSQCSSGHVTQHYAGGMKLQAAGVLPGADMTTEAALTKLSYLLGQGLPIERVKKYMVENLQGELTVFDSDQHQFSLRDSEVLQSIVEALNLSSSQEVKQVRQVLFPPMMCAAAANGDIENLKSLHEQGGDFNLSDYDGRTPLHIASSEGHIETVRFLLQHGASLHARDRYNNTPLTDAIRFKRFDVIKLLVQTGAHLTAASCEVAARLCQAACEDDVDALLAWQMAGANLSTVDYNGISPLQAALKKKSQKAVDLLSKSRQNTATVEFENGSAAMDREEELPATQTAPPPSTEGTN